MRRNVRKKYEDENLNIKIIKYSSVAVAILAIIVFALLIYSKSLNEEVKEGTLTSEQISNILNSTTIQENTESASIDIGKSVNEISEENIIIEKELSDLENNTTIENKVLKTDKVKPTTSKTTKENESSQNNEKKEETKIVELNFERPVEGEIVREFAIDNLVYSETLQEWTTHTGIDIKAEKTTVVKSAEEGTVKTIKNDPRYGLTVIVEHEGGYQTVYSNLLTSEFVVEGEKIKKGQSIGTVGNTAAFEIADEPHLHFEIIKDSVHIDPSIYLK